MLAYGLIVLLILAALVLAWFVRHNSWAVKTERRRRKRDRAAKDAQSRK